MNTGELVVNLLLLLGLLFAIFLWWVMQQGNKSGKIAARALAAGSLHKARATELQNQLDGTKTPHPILMRLAAIGDKMPLFDSAYRAKLQLEMLRGGYRGKHAVSILLAIKFSVGMVFATGGVMYGSHLPFLGGTAFGKGLCMLGAFIIGMVVPEYVFAFLASKRRAAMSSCFPDALDLLVICTNAGNSFPVSLRRVADELKVICPPLSDEFSLTADELKLSGDTTRSLLSLGERINLPAVRALITTLTQSMRYGTPITQALRTLSRMERLTAIVSMEEKAAALAPKMVVPMLIFILPPVVCIAAGPSVVSLMQVFK